MDQTSSPKGDLVATTQRFERVFDDTGRCGRQLVLGRDVAPQDVECRACSGMSGVTRRARGEKA